MNTHSNLGGSYHDQQCREQTFVSEKETNMKMFFIHQGVLCKSEFLLISSCAFKIHSKNAGVDSAQNYAKNYF